MRPRYLVRSPSARGQEDLASCCSDARG